MMPQNIIYHFDAPIWMTEQEIEHQNNPRLLVCAC